MFFKKDCLRKQLTDHHHSYMITRIYNRGYTDQPAQETKTFDKGKRPHLSSAVLFLSPEKKKKSIFFPPLYSYPPRVCKAGIKILVIQTNITLTLHTGNIKCSTNHSARMKTTLQRNEKWGCGKGNTVALSKKCVTLSLLVITETKSKFMVYYQSGIILDSNIWKFYKNRNTQEQWEDGNANTAEKPQPFQQHTA